jgi:hypothetical protein
VVAVIAAVLARVAINRMLAEPDAIGATDAISATDAGSTAEGIDLTARVQERASASDAEAGTKPNPRTRARVTGHTVMGLVAVVVGALLIALAAFVH